LGFTVLPIQKSATKKCVATDSEIDSDGEVISGFTFFFVGCFKGLLVIQNRQQKLIR
jgi:hypothetical protein